MRDSNERGIAMITALLMIMLMSALLIGFTAVIMSDQRYRIIDHDRGQAYYAASGGIEKLTSDLGNLFFSQLSPTAAQVTNLTSAAYLPPYPTSAGITYSAVAAPGALPASILSLYYCGPSPPAPKTTSLVTVGTIGYTISFCTDATGNPVATSSSPVEVGPYAGLIALQTPYQLDVTAKTSFGGETHLVRTMNAVAIPVFQFGTFSDTDLAFFAGADFNFGGRVATNGNLFLAEGTGNTLYMTGKVTALLEVITQTLQNGVSINTAPAHAGTVDLATSVAGASGTPPCTAGCRVLAPAEGSLVGGLGSALNEPAWTTLSLSTYNGYIKNYETGVTKLSLPLLTVGGTNPDLLRRPCQPGASTLTVTQVSPLPQLFEQPCGAVSEAVSNPQLLNERLFTKASLRILLSDSAADITTLPGVTATAPVLLDTNWNVPATLLLAAPNAPFYGPISATNPPVARTPGPMSGAAAITVNGLQAAGWTNLTVNAIPAAATGGPLVQLPQPLTITKGATIRPVNCTGMTATTLTGCTNPATGLAWVGALLTGATVTTAANAVNFTSPATITTAAWPTLTTTITVSSTATLAPIWFYVPDANNPGTTVYVTCTGYTTTPTVQLTGCNTTAAVGTPKASAGAALTSNSLSAAQTGTIGGYIKIEEQSAAGVWTDVTMQILNYGIGGPNLDVGPATGGQPCPDPTPNAILRLQRLRDNGGGTPTTNGGGCNYALATGSTNAADYWPNALFDTREALLRDTDPAVDPLLYVGGVMYYVALDVQNLTQWFRAAGNFTAGTGAGALVNGTGYTVYFSDRRNNNNAAGLETAEYGSEDFVNPLSATGARSGVLDTGEDLNANGILDVYGQFPSYNGAYNSVPPVSLAPYVVGAISATATLMQGQAQVNRPVLFRHALKLIRGNNISDFGGAGLGIGGLSIVSENPVYVQGDWNANDLGVSDFNGTHAATSIIADAVTLLSNEWNDTNSFTSPYSQGTRSLDGLGVITQPWYRVAIIAGKGLAFPWPAAGAPPTDFGTDGGAHNFLRFLENGAQPVNYQGSVASFFYNRQAVGTYKCCNTVYSAPTRNYAFDLDFLNPALLPPNTPVFRDINAVGFSQELRPGK
jgi:hypothetical protein